METKKEKNYLTIFTLLIFVIFLILYISKEAGYYEYKAYNKSILTKESMQKFENDINEGKNVDITEYINLEKKDYSNAISSLGYKTSNTLEKIMNEGIKETLKIVSALFFN